MSSLPAQPQPKPPEQPLTEAIENQAKTPLSWVTVAKRGIVVAVSGVAIYLVLPSITEVLASWPRLSTLDPIWFTAAVAFEVAHFVCTFALQRIALRTKAWFPVVTAALAGNAISAIIPAGAVAGAAVQFRMLSEAGIDSDLAVGGLTSFSLLGVGALLVLPFFTLPVILFGAPVSPGLEHVALLGVAGFFLFAALCAVVLVTTKPLRWAGRTAQRIRNRILRRRPKMTGLDDRLVGQRDGIRSVLGVHWKSAVLLSAARLGFDFACLTAALRATGSHPRGSLVLLAYAISGIVGLLPITPGGLGVVEASLSGLLIVAGVNSGAAFLATLAYRLASYWIPLLAGPIAYGWFALRYRRVSSPSSSPPLEQPG